MGHLLAVTRHCVQTTVCERLRCRCPEQLSNKSSCLVQELEQEQVQRAVAAKKLPDFGPGDNLQLKLVCVCLSGEPA